MIELKETKFLRFTKDEKGIIYVINKSNEPVGFINHNKSWKKHVFSAMSEDYMFDTICLKDISDFMDEQDKLGKNKLNGEK